MKPVIPFIIALCVAPFAIAQEESPSPSTEEKASATVEEPPAATISSTPEATAPAITAETPAAKKKEPTSAASPAASTAAPKTATSSQKPAAAMAAKPGKKMSVEATLKDNENRWEASYAAHDTAVAQSLVANDFVGVYWDGKMMSKSGVIGQIKKDKDTYKSAVNEKVAVHSYGPACAVVVGTAREKGTGKDGKAFDRTFRFTDTWVDRNGQWQCVASQVMKVKG